jgi:hypothetical protein
LGILLLLPFSFRLRRSLGKLSGIIITAILISSAQLLQPS